MREWRKAVEKLKSYDFSDLNDLEEIEREIFQILVRIVERKIDLREELREARSLS